MLYVASSRVKVVDYVVGGVKPSGMFFGPGKVVVCGRHLREPLQPITTLDREKGYGKGECPYCKGGRLYNQYHKHRSIKRWWHHLQLVAAELYVEQYSTEPYWDCSEGLNVEQVTSILEDGEEGRYKVHDELYENSADWIWEIEKTTMQNAIEELNLDMSVEDLRDWGAYPPVDIDIERMIRNTTAYIAMRLDVEHVMYWQDYEEVEDELEFFGINPAELNEWYPEVDWPDIPERTTPLISAEEIVKSWANFYSAGYWYVMLDGKETLLTVYRGELREKMTLKDKATIIPHDYWNGCSGIDCITLRDTEVETEQIFNDGDSNYGIQRTNGLVDWAWNGVLE